MANLGRELKVIEVLPVSASETAPVELSADDRTVLAESSANAVEVKEESASTVDA